MQTATLQCIFQFQYLSFSGDAGDVAVRQVEVNATVRAIESRLKEEVDRLRNKSAIGSFNNPISEPCKYPPKLSIAS